MSTSDYVMIGCTVGAVALVLMALDEVKKAINHHQELLWRIHLDGKDDD